MPMWERVRLCKALATQMPQGRRFYVDTRGNVQFPERLQLSKQQPSDRPLPPDLIKLIVGRAGPPQQPPQ